MKNKCFSESPAIWTHEYFRVVAQTTFQTLFAWHQKEADVSAKFALQVVQLVILELQLPDREQDQGLMVACEENDDKLLEHHLNQPRNPNFEDPDTEVSNACLY